MFFAYNYLVHLIHFLLKIIAFFSPKIKLFVDGRKDVFRTLSDQIKPADKTIWFHAASLGEYEQGLPVIEKIKLLYPNYKIVLTFFSPSGYEVRKHNKIADVTVYLPLDSASNARKFFSIVRPSVAFFIKYEFWPNYLNELKKQQVKTYLISGIFRENQLFFKWYGAFYVKSLHAFSCFFVQNDHSKRLLESIGFTNIKVSGDTRFDRVASILEHDNSLNFVEIFKQKSNGNAATNTIVVGSSWPQDEALLTAYINQSINVKFIIAPHNIKYDQIIKLKSELTKKVILHSEIGENLTSYLSNFDVLIVDKIGLLTKIYSYADIAYVGGGFGNPGVHNILEPATFGIPIVIGKNYNHFAEATALVNLGGCITINNQEELNEALNQLIQNQDIRLEKGHICGTFVQMNKGATKTIIDYVHDSF